MPLPTKKQNESRKKFVSRCVSELSKKGEGKSVEQRVAICHSRWEKSRANEVVKELTREEEDGK